MQTSIGISIVTYNSAETIIDCLTSLEQTRYKEKEIIIIDNHSTDETKALINKYFPRINIVVNKQNVGFAAAHNQAIKIFLKQKKEYILLLNPDTIAKSNLLEELIKPFAQDEKIAITGPIITYREKPNTIWFAGGIYNKFFCFTRHPHMNKVVKQARIKAGEVDFITGACLIVRSIALKKVGLLPEKYFLYFEDSFFCQEVRKKAFSCYLVNKPLLFHHVSSSTGNAGTNQMNNIRAYYFARNPLLYIAEQTNPLLKCTKYFGQFFIRLPHYIWQISNEKNLAALSFYLRGIKDGLRGRNGKGL